MSDEFSIETLEDPSLPEIKEMLVELALDEQKHFDHPQQTREQLQANSPPLVSHFVGENVVFVARDSNDVVVGMAWCVLFDPGSGLEGELAELYVRPETRGQGVGRDLCKRALELFRLKRVTFACVWTRDNNPAALAAYRSAGFTPTEQTVLTWLPR